MYRKRAEPSKNVLYLNEITMYKRCKSIEKKSRRRLTGRFDVIVITNNDICSTHTIILSAKI